MNKTAKRSKEIKMAFDKAMKTHENKEINLYGLFYQGYATGYNARKKEEVSDE